MPPSRSWCRARGSSATARCAEDQARAFSRLVALAAMRLSVRCGWKPQGPINPWPAGRATLEQRRPSPAARGRPTVAWPLPQGALSRSAFGEHARGDQHRLADQGHTDVAREMEQDLDQLVLAPSLLEGKPQVDIELGMTPRRGIRDDADQRARLEVEAGPAAVELSVS